MYTSYQFLLALVHAQAAVVGFLAFYDLTAYITTFLMRVIMIGTESIDYLSLIPWFLIIQSYALFLPKAVRMLILIFVNVPSRFQGDHVFHFLFRLEMNHTR